MITTLSLLLTGAWCAVALYQIWQDWHYRVLPFVASFIGFGIGAAWYLFHWVLMTGSWWWMAHVLGVIVIGLATAPFWWYGKLGLGDVVSMIVFGLIFGLMPALVIIMVGYVLTGIGMAIRWIFKGPWNSSDAVPLGPGLWSMAILAWIWLMVVKPTIL